jgi:hypothetical protein
MASIAAFYETSQATVLSHNAERLGPHPYNATVAVGMQLRVPHPHPHPDPSKPCEPDKWGDLWSCFHVPDRIPNSSDTTNLQVDDDQVIMQGQDLYVIAQLAGAHVGRICELNQWIDCSPWFYCNGTTPGMGNCSVLIQPTYLTGVLLTVAHTSCTPPADNSYSCAQVPLPILPASENNGIGLYDLQLRASARDLKARGPSPALFDYKSGVGSEVATAWYQAHMNLNAYALPKFWANPTEGGGGRPSHSTGPLPCLQRNTDQTKLESINECRFAPGMHIKVPNSAACATADPNACYTWGVNDERAVQEYQKCMKNSYTKDQCKWNGGNDKLFLAKDQMPGGFGSHLFGADFYSDKYPKAQCPTGTRCNPFVPENSVVTLGTQVIGAHMGGAGEVFYPQAGAQFKIPSPKTIAGGSKGDYQLQQCSKTMPGCSAVPDSTLPLNECVDTPGKHWCYRMQFYNYLSNSISTGDYFWNVSQNVPSVPMNCVVDDDGRAIDCPLCPDDVYNCSLVYPLSAVEIPIDRPPPTPPTPPPTPAGQCTLDAYQQCGGQGGPFGCCKGKCECQKFSDFFMQCEPPSGWSQC